MNEYSGYIRDPNDDEDREVTKKEIKKLPVDNSFPTDIYGNDKMIVYTSKYSFWKALAVFLFLVILGTGVYFYSQGYSKVSIDQPIINNNNITNNANIKLDAPTTVNIQLNATFQVDTLKVYTNST